MNQNSLNNVNKKRPIGHVQKVGRYWRAKRGPGDWVYVHIALAEEMLGRKLAPNERVYFKAKKPSPQVYKNPTPDDIEIRKVAPQNGRPPGRRAYWIRRYLETEFKLEQLRERIAEINEYYNRKPDDMSDPSIPRDWKPGKK